MKNLKLEASWYTRIENGNDPAQDIAREVSKDEKRGMHFCTNALNKSNMTAKV